MSIEPTNGWSRADILDCLMDHFFEATGAMEKCPDMNGSDLHIQMLRHLEAMQEEFRNIQSAA